MNNSHDASTAAPAANPRPVEATAAVSNESTLPQQNRSSGIRHGPFRQAAPLTVDTMRKYYFCQLDNDI